VALRSPTHDQRLAVQRLLGSPPRAGGTLTVDLGAVEAVLRGGLWPDGLADAVQQLSGPLTVRRAAAQRLTAAWEAAADAFAPGLAAHPGLRPWFESWLAEGGAKRAARSEARRQGRTKPDPVELAGLAADLLGGAARVLEALPAPGQLRSVFARRVLGEAHALDRGRPLASILNRAVEALTGCADSRQAWSQVGILASSLASTVLALGVPGGGLGAPEAVATAVALEQARAVPMPLVLTLDQVRSGAVRPLSRAGPAVVFVCENPSILESAATALRAAGRAPPATATAAAACLICVAGQPSLAAVELIQLVASAGATVRYHGDFDWAGLQIAVSLSRSVDWQPWRFEAADYLEALAQAGCGPDPARLGPNPTASPWDPALADAMALEGIALEEEAVVARLIQDVEAAWWCG
jgi:uncharacterized protein (TIGR02679 family)